MATMKSVLGRQTGLHALLDVGDGGIGLHFAIHCIRDAGLVHHVGHHLGHAEADEVFVGHHEGFLVAQTGNYGGQFLACAGAEVGHFVKDKSVYHD